MKWLLLILIVVLIAVFVPMTTLGWTNHVASKPIWVTRKPDLGDISVTASATGNVEPLFAMQVGSQASGRVKEVFVAPNDHVKAGQILAVLDSDLLDAERKDREIALRQAKSIVGALAIERDQIDYKEKRLRLNIEQARVMIEGAEANVDLAAKTLQRFLEMKKVSAATQSDVDIRTIEAKNAERELRLKKLGVDQLQIDLTELDIERKALAAREHQSAIAVELAEQGLARATMNAGYASISSPIEGVVLERTVEPGQTIFALQSSLFKIISGLNPIRIVSQIDEAQVSKIHTGETVSFTVDAYQGQRFEGTVNSVRLKNELRQNLITYPVTIEAKNAPSAEYPEGKLRPGMTAYLIFEVLTRKNVLRIPSAALRFVPAEGAAIRTQPGDAKAAESDRGMPATVYAPDGDGVLAIPIRIGESNEDYFELVAGNVKPGTELVAAPQPDDDE